MADEEPNLTDFTALIVANYVANNTVAIADLTSLIQSVHRSLSGLGEPEAPVPAKRRPPAVPIKKSITDEHMIDLFTGRKFKSLKRFLRSEHNMSPEEYRAYWELPHDYPMVAPSYAARRSALAKSIGLGHRVGRPTPAPGAAPKRRGQAKAPEKAE